MVTWGGVLLGLLTFFLIVGFVGLLIGYLIAKWRERKIWKEIPQELLKKEEVRPVDKLIKERWTSD